MACEIIKDLTTIKKTSEVTREEILTWAKRLEVQRWKKAVLATIQETRDFDMIKSTRYTSGA